MSWFHKVEKFSIELWNEELVKLFRKEQYGPFLNWSHRAVFITDYQRIHHRDVTPEDWVEKKWISKQWLDFVEWFTNNTFSSHRLLYRVIGDYKPATLRGILTTGSDRYLSDEKFRDIQGEGFNLKPNEYIWASDNFGVSWRYGQGNRCQRMLILMYDKNKLTPPPNSLPYTYTLKTGVTSFKDALVAVVILKINIKLSEPVF